MFARLDTNELNGTQGKWEKVVVWINLSIVLFFEYNPATGKMFISLQGENMTYNVENEAYSNFLDTL